MQMRLNSGGIDHIMAENTIENGKLYPNNGNISTKSGDISQHNKKHILFIFFKVIMHRIVCIFTSHNTRIQTYNYHYTN
jgi:hypothetical protein